MKKIIAIVLMLLIMLCFGGCKTVKTVPLIEYRDSISYVIKIDTTIIKEKDSTDRYVKNDTVWLTRWHTKEVEHTVRDTVLTEKEIKVPYEVPIEVEKKVIPSFYKWCTGLFITLVVVLVIIGAVKLYLKFKP